MSGSTQEFRDKFKPSEDWKRSFDEKGVARPTEGWKESFGEGAQKKFDDQFRPSTEFERAFGTAAQRFPMDPSMGKDALKPEEAPSSASEGFYQRQREKFTTDEDGNFTGGDPAAFRRVQRAEARFIRAMRDVDPRWKREQLKRAQPVSGANDPDPGGRTQMSVPKARRMGRLILPSPVGGGGASGATTDVVVWDSDAGATATVTFLTR